MIALPIDPLLPSIKEAFKQHSHVLIKTSPGSGKTTRIPVALTDVFSGSIYVLQPRRIAARLAAERIAEECKAERGWSLGEEVGYHFRLEKKRSKNSKIIFFTEGLFLRELQSNPNLEGVSAVCLDEFHERHLFTDLSLGAILKLQKTTRPDLKCGILSATLDADGVSEFIKKHEKNEKPPFEVHQNLEKFPLQLEYLKEEKNRSGGNRSSSYERPLKEKVVEAVHSLLEENTFPFHPGMECLVFLPGMREMRECENALLNRFNSKIESVLLHGELTKEEQLKCLSPLPDKRKVILSTNIAESSVTFPRLRFVIDSGFARQLEFKNKSGLSKLSTIRISQASAIQRAGRAARVGPGKVIRLYSEKEFLEMRKNETPEILRSDPLEVVFEVIRLKQKIEDFPLLSSLSSFVIQNALQWLRTEGIEKENELTSFGKSLSELPLRLRLAVLFYLSDIHGFRETLLPLIVELQEGDLTQRAAKMRLEELKKKPLFKNEKIAKIKKPELLWVKVFPERFGKVINQNIYLTTGQVFKWTKNDYSTVELKNEHFYLFLEAEEKEMIPGSVPEIKVVRVFEVSREDFEDTFLEQIEFEKEYEFMKEGCRVLEKNLECFRELVISEEIKPISDLSFLKNKTELGFSKNEQDLIRDLRSYYFHNGSELFLAEKKWNEKLRFHQSVSDEFKNVSSEELQRKFFDLFIDCFSEIRKMNFTDALEVLQHLLIQDPIFQKLENDLPEFISLPRRKRVPIQYDFGKNPWIESRLQDFFGLKKALTLMNGNIPITLHLNAPNGKALQVTEDLERFWKVHYPSIRSELSRRYPRHEWPIDPLLL